VVKTLFSSEKMPMRSSDETSQAIAQSAARLVVEEGLDYAAAKRRALRNLGLPPRTGLPGNDELEDAVREHIALFCADTQAAELLALRLHARMWMQRLAAYRPHLGGAVWRGTATALSDLHLQLFVDDPKEVEFTLINQNMAYQASQSPGFKGQGVDVLSLHSRCPGLGAGAGSEIGVHLALHPFNDLRGALQPDDRGRTMRGDLAALDRLLASDLTENGPSRPHNV
jgi:hypothetical protein